ncbi:hypothetical protein [Agromyces humi]|uniref:hypothetical protein n=1 Tax=Agromyces humi TaxID=1766800 RepID=UPI00135B5667|nr:hypothetical protein [Agromyces humi]
MKQTETTIDLPAIEGTNMNGEGVIVGWQTPEQARRNFASTMVWDPNRFSRSTSWHIGDGVWISRCNDERCDAYVLHWGTLPAHAHQIGIGNHEVEVHGSKVAGINVGLLP